MSVPCALRWTFYCTAAVPLVLYCTMLCTKHVCVPPVYLQALRSMRAQMDVLVNEAAHKGERLNKLEEEIVGVTFPSWFQPKPKMPVSQRALYCSALFVTVLFGTLLLVTVLFGMASYKSIGVTLPS